MAPGASKPSKLLLQYSIEVPLGVPSVSVLLCLEINRIGLGGASASSFSSSLRRHRHR